MSGLLPIGKVGPGQLRPSTGNNVGPPGSGRLRPDEEL